MRRLTLASVTLALACAPEPTLEGGEESTTDESETESTGSSAGETGETSGDTAGETGTMEAGETSGDGDGDGDGDSATTTDTGATQPNGAMCMTGAECDSGFCFAFTAPGGMMVGRCSDCESDGDCPSGTCVPDIMNVGYAYCGDGALGDACDDGTGCQSGICAAVAEGLPVDLSRCSECATDADCAGDLCVPTWTQGLADAVLTCVVAGTQPNGQGCSLDAMGIGEGAACQSGNCGVASVAMGSTSIGVCSVCDEDADCAMGTCTPPSVSMMGITAGVCG